MWNMPMYGEWGWMSMGVMMLLFWIPVLALFAWLVSRTNRSSGNHAENAARPGRARELLDRRYAAGELPREQYLQMVTDLGNRPDRANDPR
jgi:putative membrane protein